jgi:hypothetical protein
MARKTATPNRPSRPRWRALPLLAMVAALLAVPSVAAATVIFSGTEPASPANDENPKVKGTSDGPVTLYDDAACTNEIGSGTEAEFESTGITVTVQPDSTTQIYGDDGDGCTATSISYVEDSTAPDAPTVDSTDPTSPANENNPMVKGTAEASSTVKLYTDAACTQAAQDGAGTGDASGTDAEFASPGITVTVADDSSTTFYATATDAAGNVSECSTTSVTRSTSAPCRCSAAMAATPSSTLPTPRT